MILVLMLFCLVLGAIFLMSDLDEAAFTSNGSSQNVRPVLVNPRAHEDVERVVHVVETERLHRSGEDLLSRPPRLSKGRAQMRRKTDFLADRIRRRYERDR